MKNVQIPESLFYDLIRYFCIDGLENWEYQDIYKRIQDGVNQKVDKIVAHNLFTEYKRAVTPDERENARKKYLDYVGIPSSFHTDTEKKTEDL